MNERMMYKEAGVICNELLGNVSEGKSKIYTSNKTDVENLNRTLNMSINIMLMHKNGE